MSVASSAGAFTISEVNFPDEVQVSGKKLLLNGAGIRKEYFLTIYACALYLPHPTKKSEEAIKNDVPKETIMHFIHKKVGRKKIVKGWQDGFFNNSQEKLNELQERITRFCAFFDKKMFKDDRVVLNYTPGIGTTVTINKEIKGTIPGKDFMQALWAVWLGENPDDSDLKAGLLNLN